MKRGIYVSPGARCCRDHFYQGTLSYEAFYQIAPFTSEFVSFNSEQIQQIFIDFRALLQQQRILDFDNNTSLNDEAYYNITGLRKSMISHKFCFSILRYLLLRNNKRTVLSSGDFRTDKALTYITKRFDYSTFIDSISLMFLSRPIR